MKRLILIASLLAIAGFVLAGNETETESVAQPTASLETVESEACFSPVTQKELVRRLAEFDSGIRDLRKEIGKHQKTISEAQARIHVLHKRLLMLQGAAMALRELRNSASDDHGSSQKQDNPR